MIDDESVAMFKASRRTPEDPVLQEMVKEPDEKEDHEYGKMDLAYDLSSGLAALGGIYSGPR